MSALGQKRTFALHKRVSALPPKADMSFENTGNHPYLEFPHIAGSSCIGNRGRPNFGPTLDDIDSKTFWRAATLDHRNGRLAL